MLNEGMQDLGPGAPNERVSLDAKLEKGRVVALNPEELQKRIARMQELRNTIGERDEGLRIRRQELRVSEEELKALHGEIESGMANESDLSRLQEAETRFMEQQWAFDGVEKDRLEALRELAELDPDEYGDEYQIERASYEGKKADLKRAIGEADQSVIEEIQKDIDEWEL